MPLINCKVELKFKWTKCCILSVTGNDNDDANCDNIIFINKDKKLYVASATLSVEDNQKLSKLISKGFER